MIQSNSLVFPQITAVSSLSLPSEGQRSVKLLLSTFLKGKQREGRLVLVHIVSNVDLKCKKRTFEA